MKREVEKEVRAKVILKKTAVNNYNVKSHEAGYCRVGEGALGWESCPSSATY